VQAVHCEFDEVEHVSFDRQPVMSVHRTHAVWSAFKWKPSAHDVQIEFDAVVQVSALVQNGTGVQEVHTVGRVDERQYPLSHVEQLELVAVLQVSAVVQWLTSVQGTHAEPSGVRKNPVSHTEQREVFADVHPFGVTQWSIGAQTLHTVAGPWVLSG
jgi:hypothetical protein